MRYFMKRITLKCIVVIMIAIMLVLQFGSFTALADVKKYTSIDDMDFLNINNWCEGYYVHSTGTFSGKTTKSICLKEYKTFKNASYQIIITKSNYCVYIDELNENFKFIKSNKFIDSEYFVPGNNTKYLAITLTRTDGEKNSYEEYKNMFANKFRAKVVAKALPSINNNKELEVDKSIGTIVLKPIEKEIKVYKSLDSLDFKNFSNFRSGFYDKNTGVFAPTFGRICLTNYVTFTKQKYQVFSTDTSFRMTIRELDKNLKKVNSVDIGAGDLFYPNTDTKYLAISVYNCNDSSITFERYKKYYEEGFYITLTSNIIKDNNSMNTKPPVSDITPTKTPEQQLRDIMLDMLKRGDTTARDVYSLKLNWEDVKKIYDDFITKEGLLAYNSGFNIYYETQKVDGIVKTIRFCNLDEGYAKRYEKLREVVSNITEKTKNYSRLNQLLYIHDYIVNNTKYQAGNAINIFGAGPLVEGYGNCMGYTRAFDLLAKNLGFETDMIISTSLDHAWNTVKLDGNWYHVDTTWDDPSSKEQVLHRYFLRNDEEFKNDSAHPHKGWQGTISTDTTYSNWYIHNIKSAIYYANGYYYYIDVANNYIVRNDFKGTDYKLYVKGAKRKLVITGVTSTEIHYKDDGVDKTIPL